MGNEICLIKTFFQISSFDLRLLRLEKLLVFQTTVVWITLFCITCYVIYYIVP